MKRQRTLASERPCAHCGALFKPVLDGINRGKGRYCSRQCATTARYPPRLLRFWAQVDRSGADDCWPWTGQRIPFGHGRFVLRLNPHRSAAAHRVMWMLTSGAIPAGMEVCHHCDHGWCVNPAHLFLGTQADNMRDCKQKDRHSHGERHGMAKLTDTDVRSIRAALRIGMFQARIAEDFNISPATVSHIATGRKWTHVQEVA